MGFDAGDSLGWLLAGLLAGWLGHWLFDRVFRRDGGSASDLNQLQMDSIHGALDRLGASLTERGAELQALREQLQLRQAQDTQTLQAAQDERDAARAAADTAEQERVAARVMLGQRLHSPAAPAEPGAT